MPVRVHSYVNPYPVSRVRGYQEGVCNYQFPSFITTRPTVVAGRLSVEASLAGRGNVLTEPMGKELPARLSMIGPENGGRIWPDNIDRIWVLHWTLICSLNRTLTTLIRTLSNGTAESDGNGADAR